MNIKVLASIFCIAIMPIIAWATENEFENSTNSFENMIINRGYDMPGFTAMGGFKISL